MTIVNLCPATQVPVGGIQVIYRHAELLSRNGAASRVCHPQDPAPAAGAQPGQAAPGSALRPRRVGAAVLAFGERALALSRVGGVHAHR